MLTWAYAFIITRLMEKGDQPNGIHLVIGMGCDVAIFYYIAQAIIAAHRL